MTRRSHRGTSASEISKLGVQRALGLPGCAYAAAGHLLPEPQAVHMLCLGITPHDHARLQGRHRHRPHLDADAAFRKQCGASLLQPSSAHL
jgi:hypothetical protein